jgi:hypothetical protein
MFGWIREACEGECVHSVSQELSSLKDSTSARGVTLTLICLLLSLMDRR